ncbi:hypothetical protein GQ54DRAFT_200113 [Martensiomyces pterosporus]|nr:hypothetical protein GQ54DRAFT_200113 [Martensiomyces pterosporus]
MALRHTDLREAWNGVSLPRLQFISQNASRASAAVFKAADKSVACKSHVSSMRSQTLSDIARETSMMACQTNEAIVARLGSQLLRDIQQAHVTAKTRRDLVADFSQFLQLAKARNADQPETQEHSVETAVEALCDSAQRHRVAGCSTSRWQSGMRAMGQAMRITSSSLKLRVRASLGSRSHRGASLACAQPHIYISGHALRLS